MKKAANILFLIGMILSILSAIGCLITGIICLVATGIPDLQEQLIQILEKYDVPQAQIIAEWAKRSLVASAIGLFFSTGFAIANSIISWKGRDGKTPIYILNIVFGVLSGIIVNVVGAILALIADNKNDKKEVVEAEKKIEE